MWKRQSVAHYHHFLARRFQKHSIWYLHDINISLCLENAEQRFFKPRGNRCRNRATSCSNCAWFAPIMLPLSADLAVSCWLTINWINSRTITIVSRSIYRYEIWITTLTSDSAITIEARWHNVGDHSQMLALRVLIYVRAEQRPGNEMESAIFDTSDVFWITSSSFAEILA